MHIRGEGSNGGGGLLKLVTILYLSLGPHIVFAEQIEAQLRKTGKKGQQLIFAALPIFVLWIAYLYKRGKSEAKERMENLVIGGILAATAFTFSYFFK
jgi:hypothetical protein